MSRLIRLLSVVALAASGLAMTSQPAIAAIDASCQFAAGKKLVTLNLPADDHDEGAFTLGRIPGSKRIGFDSDEVDWVPCESATVENTNKVKVVGTQQSETLVISLDGGMLGPGAAGEPSGSDEIEIVANLGDGTDTLALSGGNGGDRLTVRSRTSASFNGDDDSDISLSGVDSWRMYGSRGNDILDASGASQINSYGEEGADRLVGSPGQDNLYGDEGEPAADGNDTLIGGAGDDDLRAGGGADHLVGGADDDYLVGDRGNDVIEGGADDDYVYCENFTDGSDDISGGPGNDDAGYYARQKPLRLSLDGKANDGARGESDFIHGDVEDLSGGSRADVLIGNGVSNDLDGEAGSDVIKGMGEEDSFSGDVGADAIYGGAGDDFMYNSPGEDKHFGESGDDYLDAGSSNDGRDVFSGGSGYDVVDYSDRLVGVTIDVTDDNGDGEPGETDSVKSDFERIYGGAGLDTIRGAAGGELIYGFDGDDSINGGRGPDDIRGGDGVDDLTGGEGYDTLFGEADDDSLFLNDDSADYGDGGSGSDTAYVDAYDDYDNFESVVA